MTCFSNFVRFLHLLSKETRNMMLTDSGIIRTKLTDQFNRMHNFGQFQQYFRKKQRNSIVKLKRFHHDLVFKNILLNPYYAIWLLKECMIRICIPSFSSCQVSSSRLVKKSTLVTLSELDISLNNWSKFLHGFYSHYPWTKRLWSKVTARW